MRIRRQEMTEEDLRRHEKMKQFASDCREFSRQQPHLKRLYPRKWVAFFRGEVVDTDADLDILLERLRRAGLDPAEMPIRFMETKRRPLILALAGA